MHRPRFLWPARINPAREYSIWLLCHHGTHKRVKIKHQTQKVAQELSISQHWIEMCQINVEDFDLSCYSLYSNVNFIDFLIRRLHKLKVQLWIYPTGKQNTTTALLLHWCHAEIVVPVLWSSCCVAVAILLWRSYCYSVVIE